jgi:hypothetical protein
MKMQMLNLVSSVVERRLTMRTHPLGIKTRYIKGVFSVTGASAHCITFNGGGCEMDPNPRL